jgi:hypothetical protein
MTSTAPQSLVGWRRDRLLDVGCAPDLGARLAGDCEIELHAVLELIDRACPPELAARILARLDDDRRVVLGAGSTAARELRPIGVSVDGAPCRTGDRPELSA